MQALPKDITNQIRYILEGIKSRILEHNQERYHCGTAHCVAGWHQYFKYTKLGYKYSPYLDGFIKDSKIQEIPLAFEETKENWRLTETEAYILFDEEATLNHQFALLEWLEKGKRVLAAAEEKIKLVQYDLDKEQDLVILVFTSNLKNEEIQPVTSFVNFANSFQLKSRNKFTRKKIVAWFSSQIIS